MYACRHVLVCVCVCVCICVCVCVCVCDCVLWLCVCVCVCSHMSCISIKWPPLLPDHNNYSVLTRGCLCQQMESQAVILLECSSWFDGTCRTVNYGFISAKMYHFSLRLPPVSSVCLCVCMRERESVCEWVCVCELCMGLCVCVCMCALACACALTISVK